MTGAILTSIVLPQVSLVVLVVSSRVPMSFNGTTSGALAWPRVMGWWCAVVRHSLPGPGVRTTTLQALDGNRWAPFCNVKTHHFPGPGSAVTRLVQRDPRKLRETVPTGGCLEQSVPHPSQPTVCIFGLSTDRCVCSCTHRMSRSRTGDIGDPLEIITFFH